VKIDREQHAERERDDDAGVADDERRARPAAQLIEVHLHPDDEHEEHDAKLTDQVERGKRCRREESRLDRRGQTAKQRRAEENTGEHLAYDGGLSQAAEEDAHSAAGSHDHEQLEKQDGQEL